MCKLSIEAQARVVNTSLTTDGFTVVAICLFHQLAAKTDNYFWLSNKMTSAIVEIGLKWLLSLAAKQHLSTIVYVRTLDQYCKSSKHMWHIW